MSNEKYSADGIEFKVQTIKVDIIENGLRPTIPAGTPRIFGEMIVRSMKGNPTERPSMEEIVTQLTKEFNELFPNEKITYQQNNTVTGKNQNIIDFLKYTTPDVPPNQPIATIEIPREGHILSVIFIPNTKTFWFVFPFSRFSFSFSPSLFLSPLLSFSTSPSLLFPLSSLSLLYS